MGGRGGRGLCCPSVTGRINLGMFCGSPIVYDPRDKQSLVPHSRPSLLFFIFRSALHRPHSRIPLPPMLTNPLPFQFFSHPIAPPLTSPPLPLPGHLCARDLLLFVGLLPPATSPPSHIHWYYTQLFTFLRATHHAARPLSPHLNPHISDSSKLRLTPLPPLRLIRDDPACHVYASSSARFMSRLLISSCSSLPAFWVQLLSWSRLVLTLIERAGVSTVLLASFHLLVLNNP